MVTPPGGVLTMRLALRVALSTAARKSLSMMQPACAFLLMLLTVCLPAVHAADVVPDGGCAASPFGEKILGLDGWATG
jgi:hypothetical protein